MNCAYRPAVLVPLLIGLALPGCKVEIAAPDASSGESSGGKRGAETLIHIDGSSTVGPISMAMAEVFDDAHPGVSCKVMVSGTGGGFKNFALGQTDISNASRPIKSEEAEACRKNGIDFTELMIATDGLTVVVHPKNDWCRKLTVSQLTEIWRKDSPVKMWSDIQSGWPRKEIKLYAPDTKSGTYDYFEEVTVGKDHPLRNDYQPNTDDNVLVTGIAGDEYALGFFGYAYYAENTSRVKGVAIAKDDTTDAVLPSHETIENGTYVPLSRPLFIYVKKASLQRPEVLQFAGFHLSDEGQKLVEKKQYIRLNAEQLAASRAALEKEKGSLASR